jgi:IPT/TIG domain
VPERELLYGRRRGRQLPHLQRVDVVGRDQPRRAGRRRGFPRGVVPEREICAAISDEGANTYNGSTWSPISNIDQNDGSLNSLDSVSCPSASFCVAVDALGDYFTYTAAAPVVPTVSKVSPNTGPTSGGTAITITGTGFVSGATVVIGQGNGSGAGAIATTSVKVVSPTEITAVTGGGAKTGTWTLFVTTSGGTSAANSGAYFTYDPVPTVSKVSPNSGPTAGGTTITITGTNFVTGATVVIGQGNGTTGAIAATVKSVTSTTITATTGGGAKAGTWNLFVTTPGGTSAANSGDDFTYS